MELIYVDRDIVVCIKPPRVLSTDEPGGLPELLRQELGTTDFRTVHRLDRVVSGLMVVARNADAASALSRQIRENSFKKEYLAVLHFHPEHTEGTLTDLLGRDKARKMTYVADAPGRGIQEAKLSYRVLAENDLLTLVRVALHTGRTHQIRVQFASRGLPLVGERKYAVQEDPCDIALWSCFLGFDHPVTGERMEFEQNPPAVFPWNGFEAESLPGKNKEAL